MPTRTNLKEPVFLDLKKAGINKIAPDECFVKLPINEKYYISNHGRLYSLYDCKILKPQLCGKKANNNQYYTYRLAVEKGRYRNIKISRLVAEVFITNNDPINNIQVHHKDKNHLNDYYKNLMWVEQDEHRLLDSGRKLYLYNPKNKTLKNFKTIRKMCNFLYLDKKQLRNTIYWGEPKFTLDDNTKIYEVKDKTRCEQPIYIGVKDKDVPISEKDVKIATGLFIGCLTLMPHHL